MLCFRNENKPHFFDLFQLITTKTTSMSTGIGPHDNARFEIPPAPAHHDSLSALGAHEPISEPIAEQIGIWQTVDLWAVFEIHLDLFLQFHETS